MTDVAMVIGIRELTYYEVSAVSRDLTVREVRSRGASTQAGIAKAMPFDDSADTQAKEAHGTAKNLAVAVLNRRLGRLAQHAHPLAAAQRGFKPETALTLKVTVEAPGDVGPTP